MGMAASNLVGVVNKNDMALKFFVHTSHARRHPPT